MPFPLAGSEINAFAIGGQAINGAEQYSTVSELVPIWTVANVRLVAWMNAWDVASAVQAASIPFLWDVRAAELVINQAMAWDVRVTVANNYQTSWDVVGQVMFHKCFYWQVQIGDRTPERARLRRHTPNCGV